MSKILEKAFDASKKIVRSIFRGSPNLITTSDLNRQLEALKYQADKLDEKTGFFIEGGYVGYSLKSSTIDVAFGYDKMEYKGCSFEPNASVDLKTNLTKAAPYAYLCLVADKETLTYETDFSHEIAGAKFADGTSMRAADQIVYKNEKLVLTHSVESLNNFVGIIAFFTLDGEKVAINKNWTDTYSPLGVRADGGVVGPGIITKQGFPIKLADTYDVAFGKIQNYLGDSTVYTGGWGPANYAGTPNIVITEDMYNDYLANSPAKLIKIGPIYYVRLMGLTNGEGIDPSNVITNLKRLLKAFPQAGGAIIFKNLPSTYKIGKFMGASIGISPSLSISSSDAGTLKTKDIDSLNVTSDYVGTHVNGTIPSNSSMFSFRTLGNIDMNITGATVSVQDGMAITLMFADKNIW